MQWKDVITMAADVARNGFNVTHDLGKCSFMWVRFWYESIGAIARPGTNML